MPAESPHTGPAENLFVLIRESVLDGVGSTPERIRRAVADARLDELSPELRDYVGTMREHAYRVTDDQVAGLRDLGWSDDQIYELTVATAVGAGDRRLSAGLAALERAERVAS